MVGETMLILSLFPSLASTYPLYFILFSSFYFNMVLESELYGNN